MDFEARVGDDDEFWLSGEFDLAAIESFHGVAAVALDGQREVVIDLSELRFIDSSGIRTLLNLARDLEGKGVVLRRPQPRVRAVIDLVGIEGRDGIRIED